MEEAKTSNAAEPMIPKRRFDEINLQMKNAKQRVTELESLNAKHQTRLLLLQKQAEQLKEKHEKAEAALRVKEIFVEVGLCRKEYQELVELITQEEKPDTEELAKAIAEVIESRKNKKEN